MAVNKDIFQAAKDGDLQMVTSLVSESSENIRPEDEHEYMPLHYAACNGHIDIVDFLLNKGASMMDRVRHSQDAPIHLAASCGKSNVIEYLLRRNDAFNEREEQINVRNRQQETPLHKAVLTGHIEATLTLLDMGADMEAQTLGGSTALHIAAQNADIELAMLLLERGADPNVRDLCDNHGATPAWYFLKNDIIQGNLTAEQRDKYARVTELLKERGGIID